MFSLWGAVMGGVNFLMHGAGWMEGGLHTSYEKLAIDADLLHMVARALQPIIVDDATLAVEAIAEVGPAGHFFGVQHTQDRYRDEFYEPLISDWRNFEAWTEAGQPTAFDKANQLVKRALAEFEAPPLDDVALTELSSFVERRVAEGGVETDF
jgi:trimethylamine--corrinoid protein Co-methyltransferase